MVINGRFARLTISIMKAVERNRYQHNISITGKAPSTDVGIVTLGC